MEELNLIEEVGRNKQDRLSSDSVVSWPLGAVESFCPSRLCPSWEAPPHAPRACLPAGQPHAKLMCLIDVPTDRSSILQLGVLLAKSPPQSNFQSHHGIVIKRLASGVREMGFIF